MPNARDKKRSKKWNWPAYITLAESTVKYLVAGLFTFILGFMSLYSLSSTSHISEDVFEKTEYVKDNPFGLLLLIVVIIGAVLVLEKYFRLLSRLNTKILLRVVLIYAALFCVSIIFLTREEPIGDASSISLAGDAFARGDYSSLTQGGYVFIFPYQLAMVAILEHIAKIFGQEQYIVFQFVNVLAILLAFLSLARITELTFKDKRITNLLIILLAFCFPYMMYTTFIYGNILSTGLALFAVWMQLVFFEKEKVKYALISGVAIALAVLIKQNSLIVWVGVEAIAAITLVTRRKLKLAWMAIFPVVFLILFSTALPLIYQAKSGVKEVSKHGVPSIAWAAMGLQESPRANGWYNGFVFDGYKQTGYDAKKMKQLSHESIDASMTRFKKDPSYAWSFFKDKVLSEWNDPSYQSIWIGVVMYRSGPLSRIGDSLYGGWRGGVSTGMTSIMNVYQSIIFLGALAFMILRARKLTMQQLLLGMVVVGGFLFHMVWEAKGQYTLPYFVMIIPFAAAGIVAISDRLQKQ